MPGLQASMHNPSRVALQPQQAHQVPQYPQYPRYAQHPQHSQHPQNPGYTMRQQYHEFSQPPQHHHHSFDRTWTDKSGKKHHLRMPLKDISDLLAPTPDWALGTRWKVTSALLRELPLGEYLNALLEIGNMVGEWYLTKYPLDIDPEFSRKAFTPSNYASLAREIIDQFIDEDFEPLRPSSTYPDRASEERLEILENGIREISPGKEHDDAEIVSKPILYLCRFPECKVKSEASKIFDLLEHERIHRPWKPKGELVREPCGVSQAMNRKTNMSGQTLVDVDAEHLENQKFRRYGDSRARTANIPRPRQQWDASNERADGPGPATIQPIPRCSSYLRAPGEPFTRDINSSTGGWYHWPGSCTSGNIQPPSPNVPSTPALFPNRRLNSLTSYWTIKSLGISLGNE